MVPAGALPSGWGAGPSFIPLGAWEEHSASWTWLPCRVGDLGGLVRQVPEVSAVSQCSQPELLTGQERLTEAREA